MSGSPNNKETPGALADPTELSRARRVAYQALARRGHSRLELAGKLNRGGFSYEIISSVIKDLEVKRYLDDRSYALSWAEKAVQHRNLGPLALRDQLSRKGLGRELIEEVLQEVYSGADEEQVALRAGRKRLERMGLEGSRKSLGQLAGHLARKGFTNEVIGQVLRKIRQPRPDSPD